MTEKFIKFPINTCKAVRDDDVVVTSLKNAIFARRETQNSFCLYRGLHIRRIEIQLTKLCGEYCKTRSIKHA